MGKDWFFSYRGSGGGRKSTKKGRFLGGDDSEVAPSGCMCAVLQLFDLPQFQFALNHQPSFKPDVLLEEEPNKIPKGVEAPRNSLELEETFRPPEAASFPSNTKGDDNLNIPVGFQIRTSCDGRTPRSSTSKPKTDDFSSECSNSPGTKTPSLVARLMGLDLLPESTGSPSFSSSNLSTPNPSSMKSRSSPAQARNHQKQEYSSSRHILQSSSRSCSTRKFIDKDVTGTHSLPETPRISSARRSDVDHRLSLQINKENMGEEFEFSTYRKMGRRRGADQEDDENKSPGYYARQIVKQVKERVSRKVGLDITNTVKEREQRRDENLILFKPKKPCSKVLTRVEEEEPTHSCPPRMIRLSQEPKNKPFSASLSQIQTSRSPRLSLSEDNNQRQQVKVPMELKPQVPVPQEPPQQNSSTLKCKKIAIETHTSHPKKSPQASDIIRIKKEEQFVRSPTKNKANVLLDKKCKKTPLSTELLNISVPTLLPVKKDPSPPATKLPQKQAQASDALLSKRGTRLSSCLSHSYKEKTTTRTFIVQESSQDDKCNGASTSGDGAEFQYIQRILKRTGVDKGTPVSLAKWFSPSHPLDPSIFHYIELFHPSTNYTTTPLTAKTTSKLSLRCNRKLIFQLVDELLVDIIKPYLDPKPWITTPMRVRKQRQMMGSELIDTLVSRIQDFPSADCQVLEDIDALIDKDLSSSRSSSGSGGGRPLLLGISGGAFEEEGDNIVSEIERDIVDSLVHETATLVFGMASPYNDATD